jgi:putative heme-binding domain-containing protein
VVQPKLVAELLQASDHRARAAAIRVVSQWNKRLPEALQHLARGVNDDHPRVRLEAVRALAGIPGVRSAELAFAVLDRPIDANLDFALWQAARDLQADWLPAVEKGETDFGGNVQHLTFALQSIGSPAVVGPLVQLLKSGKIPSGREESVLTLIATLGGPAELRLVYDLALVDGKAADRRPLAAKLLSALAEAAQRRKIVPEGDLGGLATLFGPGDELDAAVARAAGYWKLEAVRPQLIERARKARELSTATQGAIDGLALLGGTESEQALAALAGKDRPSALRTHAVVALGSINLPAAAKLAVEILGDSQPGDDPTPIFHLFWQQKQGPTEFVRALGGKKVPEDVAKLGVRLARIAGRDLSEAIAVLSTAGGLTGGEKMLTPEQMDKLVAAVKAEGDAARGERIFRRSEQVCLKCHAISGAGGQVGPDLGSIGASAQIDYLIDSLLVPNKAVKENYHSVVVETNSGKVVTGIKVRQTETELVLRNSEDQEISVPVSEIDEQTNGGSIMPAGLTDALTQAEMIDLIRFLSELGKVGAYAPSQARVARRWQFLDPNHPELSSLLGSNPAAVVTHAGLQWLPAYSRVSGNLPLQELPTVIYPIGQVRVNFVRTQIDVTTGGKVALAIQAPAGSSLWIDGQSLDIGPEVEVNLPPGQHTVVFRVENRGGDETLRIELKDVAGSAAQARFSAGK